MDKYLRFFKKIISGDPILYSPQTNQEWNVQYERGKWSYLLDQQPNTAAIAATILMQSNKRKLNVLDVGCGNGALMKFFSKDQIFYTGFDVSEVAITQAKIQFPDENFEAVDAHELHQMRNKYDVIVLNEVLYYVDYKDVLIQAKNMLNQNGFLVVSMYKAWRTRLIWRFIEKTFPVLLAYSVTQPVTKTVWKVVIISSNRN